jgi:outer membrane usher protein
MRSLRSRTVRLQCGSYGLLLLSSVSFSQTPDAALQSSKISTNLLAQADAKSGWDLVVEIHVNGQTVGEMAHVLQPEPGKFYATADSFASWRLTAPAVPAIQVDGVKYFAIDSLPGATAKLDPVLQVLSISVPPRLFREQRLGPARPPLLKADSGLGMFLNHDIRLSEYEAHPQVGGTAEAGFFSREGVLTTQVADGNVTKTPRPIWLDSSFQSEFPEKRAAFTIGDTTSAPAVWSRQVYYTGLRWASKDSIRPDFTPLVLPSFAGTAVQPSTVDIYVNDMRTMHANVDPGPFTVPNIPVIGIQGDISMVVTDELGKQQVISRPFIASSKILPQGVNEYTYEAGTLRRNFGVDSWQYDSFMAEATQSRGMTPALTLDARTEILTTSQTAAAGVDYAFSGVGVLTAGAGLSHDRTAGVGSMAYGQFARQSRRLGFSASAQMASNTFRQLGLLPKQLPPSIVAQAQLSHNLSKTASLALGYLNQQNRTEAHFSAASASATWRMKMGIYMAAALNYTPGAGNPMSASISLVKTLGANRTLSVSTDISAAGVSSSQDAIQQLPVGTGYGYRVHNDDSASSKHTEGDLSYQNGTGTYLAEASAGAGQFALVLEETAAVVWMGPYVARSRTINNSFGLVEVPKLAGVPVFANNQMVGKTSGQGVAVIPNLVPYQQNTVRLDDDGVPVDINLDLSERKVIPRSLMGVLVKFAAHHEQGALLALITEDKTPLPLGAMVRAAGDDTSYEVLLGGEVFIPSLSFPAHLVASWDNGQDNGQGKGQNQNKVQCEVTINQAPIGESLPRIGPLICTPTK